MAVEKNQLELVQILADKGCDPNRITIPFLFIKNSNSVGAAAIHIATENTDIFHYLMSKGGDYRLEDAHQKTPLFYAIGCKNEDVAEELIKKGDTASVRCNDQRTPLHDAAERDLIRTVQNLIEAGADINSQNWNLVTPLHLACKYGRVAMVQFLLENGAAIDAQDDEGNTPLHVAAKNNFKEIAQILIINQADHLLENKDGLKAQELANEQLKKDLNEFIIQSLMSRTRGIDLSMSNLGICVICQKEQACYTFLPCHHTSLCEECYHSNKDSIRFCIQCRKTLTSVRKGEEKH
jgi:ankyrin repeat protein